MNKCKYWMFVAALFAISSCNSDYDVQQNTENTAIDKVSLSVDDYVFDDDTRTALEYTGSKISFAWDEDEVIGIFPIQPTTNAQAYQRLERKEESGTSSTFDGAGWALMRGHTYAAYYPYQNLLNSVSYESIPVNMNGQRQNGNSNIQHIGDKYDYMYAVCDVPATGNVNFKFNHVASIAVLQLTMPKAATWRMLTLVNSESKSVFVRKGNMNVATGEVTATVKAPDIQLALDNIKTTAADEVLTLFMSVLPTTTGDMLLTVTDDEGVVYTASVSTYSFEAGKAYRIKASPVVVENNSYIGLNNGYEYVDLGLKSGLKWATMNIGAVTAVDRGTYFAWGETEGYDEMDESNLINYTTTGDYTKTQFSWATYKYCMGYENSLTKYCGDYDCGYNEFIDDEENESAIEVLEAIDDVATMRWQGTWRMPTHKEFQELVNECYWVWTDEYMDDFVSGYIVYRAKNSADKGVVVSSNKTPSSAYTMADSHIFLPITYCRNGKSLRTLPARGCYWSSSLNNSFCNAAWALSIIDGDGPEANYSMYRYYGFSVRPVCE